MKKSKILLPMMAVLLFGMGLSACNKPADQSKPAVSSVAPQKETIKVTAAGDKKSIVMEETLQLSASVEGVTWASDNTALATVDASGKVTAVSAGEVVISATKDGYYKGSITITVTRPAAIATLDFEDADHYAADGWWGDSEDGATPVYAKESASGGKCIAHFDNGDKETLTFTSSAAIKAEFVIKMASSSTDVDLSAAMAIKLNNADVSLANKVLAGGSSDDFQEVSLGELNIATNNVLEISFLGNAPYLDGISFYGKQTATIAAVKPAAKEAIEVSTPELNLNLGETAQINITKPTDKTGVGYAVGNAEFATVDANGKVSAVALGSTYVIVKKDGMLSVRVAVTVTDKPVPGEIRVEAEDQEEGFDFESLGFHMYPDGSYIRYGHSGGAYITGYDVTEEVSLTYKFNSEKAQTMSLVIAAAPHYNMQAGDEFKFAVDSTIKLNASNVSVNADAKIVGDGAAMGAKTQNVTIGDVQVKQGENVFVIEFHGKAPALDCFKFLPKA